MRIICPNCEAEYEVEDRLIPATGRDVQCSNCGHGWFQLPPGSAAAEAEEADEAADEPPPPPAPAPPPPAPAPPPPAPAPPPPRPPLDDALRAILQEEAAREAAARAAEAARRRPAPMEVQPDLGLPPVSVRPAPPPPPREPPPDGDAAAATAEPARATRRERLPDIETINSSLTAGGGAAAAAVPRADAPRRAGFVQGFAAVFLVAGVLYGLYLLAPRIGAAVPAMAGPLAAYTQAVDAGYRTLQGLLRPGGGGGGS